MTTVAWDGKMLAADTLMVGNFLFQKRKLHKVKDMFVCCCGEAQQMVAFRNWLKDGEKPKDMEGFAALVVKGRICKKYESMLIPHVVPAPFAIGSGCEFAMGAMLAGKSAKQAVKIASKLDVYTGGRIIAIKVK